MIIKGSFRIIVYSIISLYEYRFFLCLFSSMSFILSSNIFSISCKRLFHPIASWIELISGRRCLYLSYNLLWISKFISFVSQGLILVIQIYNLWRQHVIQKIINFFPSPSSSILWDGDFMWFSNRGIILPDNLLDYISWNLLFTSLIPSIAYLLTFLP